MIAKYIEGESGYKEDEEIVGGLAFTVYSGMKCIFLPSLELLVCLRSPFQS